MTELKVIGSITGYMSDLATISRALQTVDGLDFVDT